MGHGRRAEGRQGNGEGCVRAFPFDLPALPFRYSSIDFSCLPACCCCCCSLLLLLPCLPCCPAARLRPSPPPPSQGWKGWSIGERARARPHARPLARAPTPTPLFTSGFRPPTGHGCRVLRKTQGSRVSCLVCWSPGLSHLGGAFHLGAQQCGDTTKPLGVSNIGALVPFRQGMAGQAWGRRVCISRRRPRRYQSTRAAAAPIGTPKRYLNSPAIPTAEEDGDVLAGFLLAGLGCAPACCCWRRVGCLWSVGCWSRERDGSWKCLMLQ